MSYFTWHPGIEVGHAQIDAQHRHLFSLADRIVEMQVNVASPDSIEKPFNALVDFAKKHYAYETDLMRAFEFEQGDEHVIRHAEALASLQRFHIWMRTEPLIDVSRVITFLWHWLHQHIDVADREFVAWLGKIESDDQDRIRLSYAP